MLLALYDLRSLANSLRRYQSRWWELNDRDTSASVWHLFAERAGTEFTLELDNLITRHAAAEQRRLQITPTAIQSPPRGSMSRVARFPRARGSKNSTSTSPRRSRLRVYLLHPRHALTHHRVILTFHLKNSAVYSSSKGANKGS